MLFVNPYLEGVNKLTKPLWHRGHFEIFTNFRKKSKKSKNKKSHKKPQFEKLR